MLRGTKNFILRKMIDTLNASVYGRRLIYEKINIHEFSDLYEHEKMLADQSRINKYYEAIQRYINPGDVVLDLGTGTGILIFSVAKKP